MNRGYLGLSLVFIAIIFTACMDKNIQKRNLAIDPANMELKTKPGDNFYEYANGNWVKNNPIGDEYSQYCAFTELREQNKKQLKELVEEVSLRENVEQGSAAQKIRDLYNSGMDSVKIDQLGIQPIQKYIDRIDKIGNIDDVRQEIIFLHNLGMSPAFSFYGTTDPGNSQYTIATHSQGGLGLPDVEYYTGDDARSKEIREKYIGHVARMFVLTGISEDQAQKDAEALLKFETRMAENSMTRLEQRNPVKTYHRMTVEELMEMAPGFNWRAYYEGIGTPPFEEINVKQPGFYKNFSDMLSESEVNNWKTYLKWNLINQNASFLGSPLEIADFDFYEGFLSGVKEMKPRWKRVMDITSGYLGEPVGKIYVEKHFPPQAKERMVELVGNLKEALASRIDKVTWMSAPTKQKALEKLASMTVKVGYPDPEDWIDYSSMDIVEGDYLSNIFNARAFHNKRNIEKIGTPVNRNEWIMPPQTVNAGYIPSYNQIIFPAGILQPPFFFM